VLRKEDAILGKAHGPLEKFAQDLKLLFAVARDYANGTYRELPWTTIAGIAATLIYVFSPIDLIPDIIPVAGLSDDALVVLACLKCIENDLQRYKDWKNWKLRAAMLEEKTRLAKNRTKRIITVVLLGVCFAALALALTWGVRALIAYTRR